MNNLVRNKEIIYRFHLTKIDVYKNTLFYKVFLSYFKRIKHLKIVKKFTSFLSVF